MHVDPRPRAQPLATPPQAVGSPLPDAVRAQLLATEHWSLLGTRSMTWSEVMGRISIHLTVASASLVVLALVAQSSGFGTAFDVLSIGLASAMLVLGTLTNMRVHNATMDDAQLVLGMNRIRAAYLRIDPSLGEYFVTSAHDDEAGLMHTYTMGVERSRVSHILASTTFFMYVVNAIVAGTLGALIAARRRRLRSDVAGGGRVGIHLPRGDARAGQAHVQAAAGAALPEPTVTAGASHRHLNAQRGEPVLADPVDLLQLVDRREPAVRRTPLHDALRGHRSDSWQCL
jgi:hypothetical protein